MRSHLIPLAATAACLVLISSRPGAYTLNGPTWHQSSVPYYINPANLDLVSSAAEAAVRAGAATWEQQAGIALHFAYAGSSTQTTTGFDNVNLVVFRNASSGSAIATTYWWSNSSGIVDADIVFWDGAFQFFAGTTGCSGGFYIEDIAAHEFGHVLGLGHSTSTAATMYPSTSTCNTANRSLDADDISGARALYPLASPSPPTPPTNLRIVS